MSARILIAGGGTGGHVFPGVAIADALVHAADVAVTFCGTERGLEARVIPQTIHALETLHVEPMKGGGLSRMLRGGAVAAAATAASARILARLRPRLVLAVGGYAAGPIALAAQIARIPVALLEPNATAGFTNQLLAPGATRIFTAFAQVKGLPWRSKYAQLGVPVRAGYMQKPYPFVSARRGAGSENADGPLHLLVLGGSQGASHLNATIPDAVAQLKADPRFASLAVIHQTGRGNEEAVAAKYRELGIENVLVRPFFDDPRTLLEGASLIVSRSGAVTVAEIRAVGRPAIFVPFPQAADDHQTANADAVAAEGGAVRLAQKDADATRLALVLGELLGDPARRARMAAAAAGGGHPDAARNVADELLHLAGIPRKRLLERVGPVSDPASEFSSQGTAR